MTDWKRWRGLRELVEAVVEEGASAVERVHLATARRPFAILEQLPAVKEPVQVVHEVHDTVVLGAYTSVRLVNRWVGKALEAALELAETAQTAETAENAGSQADAHESAKLK
jgi:hypothetical protein